MEERAGFSIRSQLGRSELHSFPSTPLFSVSGLTVSFMLLRLFDFSIFGGSDRRWMGKKFKKNVGFRECTKKPYFITQTAIKPLRRSEDEDSEGGGIQAFYLIFIITSGHACQLVVQTKQKETRYLSTCAREMYI